MKAFAVVTQSGNLMVNLQGKVFYTTICGKNLLRVATPEEWKRNLKTWGNVHVQKKPICKSTVDRVMNTSVFRKEYTTNLGSISLENIEYLIAQPDGTMEKIIWTVGYFKNITEDVPEHIPLRIYEFRKFIEGVEVVPKVKPVTAIGILNSKNSCR